MLNFSKKSIPKSITSAKAKRATSFSASEIIYGDVEFGNPQINCRNFGICKVTIVDRLNETYTPTAACAAILFFNNQIELRFSKKDMHPDVINKYFLTGDFQIDSQFIFSKEIQYRVKSGKFKIQKGKYPIIQNEDFFILKL